MKAQFVAAIAFAGDLSMGQPPEHSPRVALLAIQAAQALLPVGAKPKPLQQVALARLALIRWAGCSANAQAFADLFGDDIRGRGEMLAARNPFIDKPAPAIDLQGQMQPLAHAHCEAMGAIADQADLRQVNIEGKVHCLDFQSSIDDLFEHWDGSGYPHGKVGESLDLLAQMLALASDLEIFSRHYGVNRALLLIEARGGSYYDPVLAQLASQKGALWLDDIAAEDPLKAALTYALLPQYDGQDKLQNGPQEGQVEVMQSQGDEQYILVQLLSDYAALKQPQLTPLARRSADYGQRAAQQLGLANAVQKRIQQAALLHRLGVIAIANSALPQGHVQHVTTGGAEQESLRLAPYWTERILSRAPVLGAVAKLASLAFETLDGSGFFRGLTATALPLEARVLQASCRLAELTLAADLKASDAIPATVRRQMLDLVEQGKLDSDVVNTLLQPQTKSAQTAGESKLLTQREIEVLACLTQGLSNKAIAAMLNIAPKTVGTHLEHIYRKLEVKGRTAATMKALQQGWVS